MWKIGRTAFVSHHSGKIDAVSAMNMLLIGDGKGGRT